MWDGVMWTGLVWLKIGTGGELLREFGIEPSGGLASSGFSSSAQLHIVS
jgi:hypothetical protein